MKVSRTHLGLLYLSTLLFSVHVIQEEVSARRWFWVVLGAFNVVYYAGHLLWLIAKRRPSRTTRP